jgi:lipoprotein-releasing system permease protein
MGAERNLISRIYLTNGMMAALLGAGMGLLLGYLVCLLQLKFHFLKLSNGSDSSFVIDYYPVEFRWIDPVVTMLVITAVSLAAAYFPAKRAGMSRMDFK